MLKRAFLATVSQSPKGAFLATVSLFPKRAILAVFSQLPKRALLATVSLLLCLACGDDGLISQKFCNLPARFSYNPVSAVSQLYTSCNSMGQWCTVIASGQQFIFANPEGSTSVNRTAVQNYTGFSLGLSGFLVGLPNIPELGSDYPVVTCYDLACRNCHEEAHAAKRLTLSTGGRATCPRCDRTYDLNNQGLVSQGQPGKSLYRYRVYYGNNTLAINNR